MARIVQVPRDQGHPKNTNSRRSNEEDSPERWDNDDTPTITDIQANFRYDLTLFEHDWKYPADGLHVSAKLTSLRSIPEGQGEMVLMGITFVFHLGSNTSSRVSRASIKILPYNLLGDDAPNMRIIPYFSPRAIFGKFSKESLMWQFSPGKSECWRFPNNPSSSSCACSRTVVTAKSPMFSGTLSGHFQY